MGISLETKILFRLSTKFMNVKFSSPYFQSLAGQEIKEIKTKTVAKEEFDLICKKQSKRYNKFKEIIFVSRDKHGGLLGSCYIDKYGNLIKSHLPYS